MKHPLILALAAGATLLFAGAVQAGNVHWSIGINLQPIGTVISNGPYYAPVPASIYYPAPVRYVAPVVYESAPVGYESAPVVYESAPVGYDAPPFFYRGQRPFYGARGPVGRPEVVFHDHDGRNVRWEPSRHDRYDRDNRDNRGDRRWHRD